MAAYLANVLLIQPQFQKFYFWNVTGSVTYGNKIQTKILSTETLRTIEGNDVIGSLKFTTLNGKLDFSKKKEKMSERKGFAIL